jgi:hypothetical protein
MPTGHYIRTDEWKEKHAIAVRSKLLGRKRPAWVVANIRASRTYLPVSGETRVKMSKSATGRKMSETTKEKLSVFWMGKKKSLTMRKKLSLSKRGNKTNFWNGGINPIRLDIKNSFQYKAWRSSVYERDNYTCQICGIKGGKLNAHHLKRFEILVREAVQLNPLLNKYDAIIAYSPIWYPENGITVCFKCHKQIHKTNGGRLKSEVKSILGGFEK